MKNGTTLGAVVLKTDVLGRVRTPGAQRERLLDQFERSGLSGAAFARSAGIKYQTFASWAQQRRRQRRTYPAPEAPARTPAPVRLLEAVLTPNGVSPGN